MGRSPPLRNLSFSNSRRSDLLAGQGNDWDTPEGEPAARGGRESSDQTELEALTEASNDPKAANRFSGWTSFRSPPVRARPEPRKATGGMRHNGVAPTLRLLRRKGLSRTVAMRQRLDACRKDPYSTFTL